jgi:hypothetical protein
MSITWRDVRTWGTARRRGHAPAAEGAGDDGRDDDLARHRAERCGASGWRMRLGCTDGNGGAICPLCGQPVQARRDTIGGPAVRVIQEHVA